MREIVILVGRFIFFSFDEYRSRKPCFVLDNNLSMQCMLLAIHFSPSASPTKFGFLACGVCRVPLDCFQLLRHCGTFRKLTIVSLRYSSAVMRSRIPSVIFSASAITTGISACASMDFPLELIQQLSRPNFIYLMLLGFTPNFHKYFSNLSMRLIK